MARTTNRIPPIGGGDGGEGSRSATLIIAPSNATTLSKEQADFVATGVNDEVLINNVISQLPAQGGKIQLLEGTFIIEGTINLVSNMTLSGVGGSTLIKNADGLTLGFNMLDINTKTGILIENLKLDGNYPSCTGIQLAIYVEASNDITISNVNIENTASTSIQMITVEKTIIKDCVIKNSNNRGIEIANSQDMLISKNTLDFINERGIIIISCIHINIDSNILKNITQESIAVTSDTVTYTTVSKRCNVSENLLNTFVGGGSPWGIRFILDVENSIISNNVITEKGISVRESTENIVTNNTILKAYHSGISISENSHNNSVVGNLVSSSSQAVLGSYSNIVISSGSDNNNIQNNLCRKGTETNKPNFGITVGSGCNRTLVTNNDLYDSGLSGSYTNSGLNTVTSAGNRL